MHPREADTEDERHWRRRSFVMPEKCAPLPYEEQFTAEESARLLRCVLPDDMADKWMVFVDDFRLSFHRSWTGFCIYAVTLVNINEDDEPNRYITCDPVVSREPTQYSCTDDAYDSALLSWLIRTLILHQEIELPTDPSLSAEESLIAAWGFAGNAAFPMPPSESGPVDRSDQTERPDPSEPGGP